MVAGVCGGLGRYFDVNPTFYRVGFVVLALLGGAGILIYGAAVLVMPDEGRDESIVEEAFREPPRPPRRGSSASRSSRSPRSPCSRTRGSGRTATSRGCCCSSPVVALLAAPAGHRARAGRDRAAGRRRAGPLAPAPAPPSPRRSFPLSLRRARRARRRGRSARRALGLGRRRPLERRAGGRRGAVGVALVGGAFLHLRVGGLVVIGLVLGDRGDPRLDDRRQARRRHRRPRLRTHDRGRPQGRVPARNRRAATRPGQAGAACRRDPRRCRASASASCTSSCRPRRPSASRATSAGVTARCSASDDNGHDVDDDRDPAGRREARRCS